MCQPVYFDTSQKNSKLKIKFDVFKSEFMLNFVDALYTNF